MAGKQTKESKFNVTLVISETVTQVTENTRYNGDDHLTQSTHNVVNVEMYGTSLEEVKRKIDSIIAVEDSCRAVKKDD